MRPLLFIWMLVPVVFMTACERSEIPHVPAETQLNITIEFPKTGDFTKGDEGEVPASLEENAIYDLKLWVFNASTHDPVAQLEANAEADFPSGGGVRRYALPVDAVFSRTKPNVDVFVLVNGPSIGSTLTTASSWGDVDGALFGTNSDNFSPANPVHRVPQKGLPMSGVGKNLPIGGDEPSLSLATVTVRRAVSKLRYVFCQMLTTGEDTSFEVEKVVLSDHQIPTQEYLFSEDSYRIVPGYYVPVSMETYWPVGESMAISETPEAYSYAGQEAAKYEQTINAAVAAGKLSDLGITYLRESDKQLSGTVYYSVTKAGEKVNKTMSFSMAAPGDFARNHTWVLYGYYISDRSLQLSVNVLPWDKNNYTVQFNTSSLQVTQKFTVDPNSAQVVPAGTKDHFNVFLDANKAARGYLFVTTPQGGKLEVIPEGSAADLEAFTVTPVEATIDPYHESGRIDIAIDRNRNYTGDTKNRTITLSFKAYTPDGEREISGSSECIDQVYHFYL